MVSPFVYRSNIPQLIRVLSRSRIWLMNGPEYGPLLPTQPWLLLAPCSQDQWPPEKAVIRIHFFLLCALVHCLSSSVQCKPSQ